MQGTNAHVAVEISPNSQSKNVFSPILQPWKRERHWYLPNIHRFLSFFQFRCAQGKQTCFLQSSIQSLPSLASMKELKFGNMSILPASYGLEVSKISDQSHSILVSLRSIFKLSLTKKKSSILQDLMERTSRVYRMEIPRFVKISLNFTRRWLLKVQAWKML